MDMEQQQLDPKLANTTLWLNQEEEEEEVGVDLLARRSSSRVQPNGNGATAVGVDGELLPAATNGTIPEMEEKEDAPVTVYGGENEEGGGNTSLWLNQEEGEEEVGVDLLARRSSSRIPPNGNGATATGADGELQPAPTNGTTPAVEEKEDASVTVYSGENEEGGGNSVYFDKFQGKWKCRHCNWDHKIGDPCMLNVLDPVGYLHVPMSSKTLNQWCLETEGTESIYGTNEMQSEITELPSMDIDDLAVRISEDKKDFGVRPAPVEHLHEAYGNFKHFENGTKVEANVDLIEVVEEFEEDLVDLNVESVLKKQNTHDLYCPNCKSCITKKVILIRRRPKVSIRPKPKRGSKVDPISDTPEIHSDISPVAAPDEQNDSREQEQKQEAISCLSCFSLFIPTGNGCFKFFKFFRWGQQTEHTQSVPSSTQGTKLSEYSSTPQGINPSENTHSPQVIIPEGNVKFPEQISHYEDIQSPQKLSHDANMCSPQHINHTEDAQKAQPINHTEDAQKAQPISWNEDKPSHQKIGRSENAQSPQDINQNNNIKQNHRKITTDLTDCFVSIFASKHKETAGKVGHAISVQSDVVTTSSVIDKGHIDGADNIFSSTHSSLLDKPEADSTEQKPDADMLQRIVGDEIKDIEIGLPLLQRTTETERTGSDAGEVHEWEILKSIVYGGLIESITSLGVVSSAAGAGADTLNVLALGVANLIGGLIIICHNLIELRNDQPRVSDVEEDRYQALLGRRQNFVMHVIVAVLSFLVSGLVPPVVYGFSFRKSDDKDLKLAAVAGASLICIFLLALGKGHVRRPHRAYFRSVSYYIGLGITASGISYVVGQLIKKLLEQLGLFETSSTVSLPFLDPVSMEVGRASY